MEPTDRDLMVAVSKGDAEKFGILFDRHHQSIFSFFYRLTGDASTSEDLVQDVFLRMLKYRHTFKPDSHFRGWMYRIARAARFDRFKKQRDETFRHHPDFESDAQALRVQRPDQQFEDAERAAQLERALLQLPEDKRELIILARFQEMEYAEIASLLDVEPGTIKVRVHRAIKELRDIVQKMSDERNPCNVTKSDPILPTI